MTYLCHLVAVPSIFLGYNHFPPEDMANLLGGIASIFCVQTWIVIFGFGPNPPSWTISTLVFFYLTFPSLVKYAEKQSNAKLTLLMTFSHYLQLFVGITLYNCVPKVGQMELNFWLATAHPLSRLPVFFMGICSAILVMRWKSGNVDALQGKQNIAEEYF